MSAFEIVILTLVVIWTPGIAFAAFLLAPRGREIN